MVRREAGSVVVEFDMTGMDDEIAILSGRPDTAALMEQIAAELGADATPDELVAEFKARWRSLHRIARRNKVIEEELV
jgi:type IV secretion system protein VirB4